MEGIEEHNDFKLVYSTVLFLLFINEPIGQ